jgi:hypothetical protein
VVGANTVYVAAHVPESDLARLRQITGAKLQTAQGAAKPVGRLVSTGRVVDYLRQDCLIALWCISNHVM